MTEIQHPKINLKLISPFLTAPPVLVASTHTIDYCCGNCSTVLLHAEEDQVHSLLIKCAICGCSNTTEG